VARTPTAPTTAEKSLKPCALLWLVHYLHNGPGGVEGENWACGYFLSNPSGFI